VGAGSSDTPHYGEALAPAPGMCLGITVGRWYRRSVRRLRHVHLLYRPYRLLHFPRRERSGAGSALHTSDLTARQKSSTWGTRAGAPYVSAANARVTNASACWTDEHAIQ
jgi:hypothetical protein